ncbi:GTPase EngC [Catenovulum agarivorans DS-2]|uniref:GTPase EngC n=1 Tax=Catenovulum agarivorans DS-2 TaxID=1328313 RepID=W7QKP4_9ALTE|nr:beta-galactosidase [Catenovulum agarivorans]EWH08638.1 GTPase EngC [Catenovulum agarivorans DS-2]
MKIRSKIAAIPLLGIGLAACQSSDGNTQGQVETKPDKVLFDFENSAVPVEVKVANATASIVKQGATSGDQALNVKFNSKAHEWTSIEFTPAQPWDWSEYESFSIAFDISNVGQYSTQLFLNVFDKNGQVYTRSVNVPVGEDAKTYYSKMAGHDLVSPKNKHGENVELNLSSGLRSNPPTWNEGDDQVQFIWMWGNKNLDTSGITKISLSVQYNLHNKEVTIDNVRVMPNPKMDPDYLVDIVDKFGQPSRMEYEEKIHSEAELLAVKEKELAELQGGKKISDRTKFSGWKDGPRLEATGYFRTEKVGGKWSLVDPEGYLYFTTGIDNVRMSNATTLTGYDFDQTAINQRTADEVTPEDSQGLNPPPPSAIPTRHLVSETRKNMFEWLPDYDDPLASSYGYRRGAHSGPLERGEVFSFYMANLERKYGETTPYSYLKDWSKVTVDRMLSWGFTSFGNWIDPMYYQNNRIPYFANGWIIGDFKQVSSGNDFWGGLPDPFDPLFAERADITVKTIANEVKGSPWCVGVFIDNEKSWGRPESKVSELGIVIHTLTRDGNDSPTKNMFTDTMKAKYGSISKLNKAWGTNVASWDAFQQGKINSKLDVNNATQIADYEQLLYNYAAEYFRIVDEALAKYMPNHMYMGVRFADWGMPKPVVKAAAKYVDVVSFNLYKEGLTQNKWKFLEEMDMPTVIGEFHMGTTASGFFHPGLIHAANQEDRARMYKDYMRSIIDNDYFIGAHWFQYLDSPITGRAYDGENYNVGFVSVTDIPYNAMVKAARELHTELYERRYGHLKQNK